MNAVNLYIQTCRYVMQAQANDVSTWEDLYRYLPYLRQTLSCCVCTKILLCPMGPIESKCQHHVCRECRGGKMRLRPSCSWCKNWQEYVENNQLRLIVQCFKKLCDYLSSSFIAQHLTKNSQCGSNTLLSIITEGRTFHDDYSFIPSGLSTIPDLLPSKILASNGTSVITIKQEPIDTTELDHPTQPGCDLASTNNNESCDDNDNDNHAGDSDQQQLPAPETEESAKVTSTSGPEPPDDLVTSSSPGVPSTDARGQSSLGSADEQTQESPPGENGVLVEEAEETQDSLVVPLTGHLEHSQHQSQQPSCSSSEPASSGPNSPSYDSYSRGGHTSSVSEHDYNKDSYSGIYSVSMSNDHAPKLKIRRTDRGHHGSTLSHSGIDHHSSESIHGSEYKQKSRNKGRQKPKPKGCRCGLATPTPGKLTCCGQRCPCYSAFKGCLPECRCRGCRNPRKVHPGDEVPSPILSRDEESDGDDSEIEVDI